MSDTHDDLPNSSKQAAFLRALADHLETHQLPEVRVHWRSWHPMPVDLQLASADTTRDLVAWAASLGTTEVTVQNIEGRIYLTAHGRIGERDIEVWTTTAPRPTLLDRDSVTVAELETGA